METSQYRTRFPRAVVEFYVEEANEVHWLCDLAGIERSHNNKVLTISQRVLMLARKSDPFLVNEALWKT